MPKTLLTILCLLLLTFEVQIFLLSLLFLRWDNYRVPSIRQWLPSFCISDTITESDRLIHSEGLCGLLNTSILLHIYPSNLTVTKWNYCDHRNSNQGSTTVDDDLPTHVSLTVKFIPMSIYWQPNVFFGKVLLFISKLTA